jgi:hypothetical protein
LPPFLLALADVVISLGRTFSDTAQSGPRLRVG